MKVGDIIQALDGRIIKDKNFEDSVASLKPGSKITIDFTRGGSKCAMLVTVGKRTL
jgi:S1-C subfamily serine protease